LNRRIVDLDRGVDCQARCAYEKPLRHQASKEFEQKNPTFGDCEIETNDVAVPGNSQLNQIMRTRYMPRKLCRCCITGIMLDAYSYVLPGAQERTIGLSEKSGGAGSLERTRLCAISLFNKEKTGNCSAVTGN